MADFNQRNSEFLERSLYHILTVDDKHYIGMTATKNFNLRIDEQFERPNPYNIQPARYLQEHKAKELVDRIDLPAMTGPEAEAFEDAFTLMCKQRYGKENVCGGHECASPNAIKIFLKNLVDASIITSEDLVQTAEDINQEILQQTIIEVK